MLKSRKNVFWEALIITIAIFLIGLYIGILIETSNTNKISNIYIRSEISLVDGLAGSLLTEQATSNCNVIKDKNIGFANQVYEEAKILERYESSGKLTDSLKLLHKKYDLLRTLLWMSNQDSLERCKNYNLIVYLYEYETEEIEKKARQNVWSKILLDIRESREDILLLPIAADQNLASLDLLLAEYSIKSYPAVVVNNKEVFYTLENKDSLNKYFINSS
jgi:hypothetical protein